MLTTFDVPLLVIAVMEIRPWIRSRRPSAKTITDDEAAAAPEGDAGIEEIYDNGQWRILSRPVDDDDASSLHPVAAHLWLLLLSLLFHPAAPRKYDLTDHRRQQLLKVPRSLSP